MIAAMRALALFGLAGAAACSGDTGLALTLTAPGGPAGASRIEIALASPDSIAMVMDQLNAPMARYYRQKSTAGEIEDARLAHLDGYVLRIEGRDGKGDEPFVPFVIAYDASSQPIAAGWVPDPAGGPLAVAIPASSRVEATVTMTALSPADPTKGIASGQVTELRCPSNTNQTWRSGLAWQPASGPQLRLLFPDPDDGSGLDATKRLLDLDCDGHAAGPADCDDVRPRFHRGAPEACDGEDTNCDGAPFTITKCQAPTTACGTDGVQLCRDTAGGGPIGMCADSPACTCRFGTAGTCARCGLSFEGASSPFKPCSPGQGSLSLSLMPFNVTCTPTVPCQFAVVETDPAWDVTIAPGPTAEFKQSATVTSGELYLRAEAQVSPLPVMPGASAGSIHLVVTVGGVTRDLGLDLELETRIDSCSTLGMSGGTFPMTCGLK